MWNPCMYTNIHTGHGLNILRKFLEEPEASHNLPPDFNVNTIVEAATLVMRWNIFVYGVTYFRKMIGTAMGTPAAVLWAIIYYYWQEKNMLISRYNDRSQMPLLVCFIDNIFDILFVGGDTGLPWKNWMSSKLTLTILGSCIDEPSLQVNYLDLTLQLVYGYIHTKTCQKPINM